MTLWSAPEIAVPRAKDALLKAGTPAEVGMSFDLALLAKALGDIPLEAAQDIFSDGRQASVVIEGILSHHLEVSAAPHGNAKWDLELPDGLAEVKCLTRRGVKFLPSGQVGSGRSYDEAAFLERLEQNIAYYVADIREFPDVRITLIPAAILVSWANEGIMRSGSFNAEEGRRVIDAMLADRGVRSAS
jgi:hypothetical protein